MGALEMCTIISIQNQLKGLDQMATEVNGGILTLMGIGLGPEAEYILSTDAID